MLRAWTSGLIVTVVLMLVSAGRSDIAPEAVLRGKRATVQVEAGEGRRVASAFCVDPAGYFVTNYQVVSRLDSAGRLVLVYQPGEPDQKRLVARVERVDINHDLAILSVAERAAFTALPLAADGPLIETTEVVAFGYPLGRTYPVPRDDSPAVTVNMGRITALRKSGGEVSRIQVDTLFSAGMTGGPLLNTRGQVIGVLAAEREGRSANLAVPLPPLRKLLTEPAVTLTPAWIPRDHIHDEVEFAVRVSTLGSTGGVESVDLTLTAAGAPPRTYTARSKDGLLFHLRVVPVPRSSGGKVLLLTVRDAESTLVCRIQDLTVTIQGKLVPLSEVREIRRGEQGEVVRRDGQVLKGAVTGLEAVPTRLGSTPVRLDLSRAVAIQVEEVPAVPGSVLYQVVVRRGGKAVGQTVGELRIENTGFRTGDGRPQEGVELNPDNGNAYQVVIVPAPVTWQAARDAAQRLTFHGAPGHLVTITSPAEQDFLRHRFSAAFRRPRAVWLGAYQDLKAADYREPGGGWRWVTGEAWAYTHWRGGEPNDLTRSSNFLNSFEDGSWNDTEDEDSVTAYLVEYESLIQTVPLQGGATVPAPEALVLTEATTEGPLLLEPLRSNALRMVFKGRTYYFDPDTLRSTEGLPRADAILITQLRSSRLGLDILPLLKPDATVVVGNPASVEALKFGTPLRNGESRRVLDVTVEAVPAYDLPKQKPARSSQFVIVGPGPRTRGLDNGYVVTAGDKRIYFSGQSELTPEMKALKNIDVAMLPLDSPRLSARDAAEAALAMRPKTLVVAPQRELSLLELTDGLRGTQIEVRILELPPRVKRPPK